MAGSSTYRRCIRSASTTMLISIVIDKVASSASVVAAFLLLGLVKAGTPLLMASTPVSAAQPEEKARASRKTSAKPVSPFSNWSAGAMSKPALGTSGRSPNR